MRKEYALRGPGKANPYAKKIDESGRAAILVRFLKAEHYVRLDDDVAAEFSDESSVNEALRLVLRAKALVTRAPARRKRRGGAG